MAGAVRAAATGREPDEQRATRMRVVLLVWVPIAIGFTLLQLRQSLYDGWLAAPPTYDDIAYFADAQSRLDTLYTAGPRDVLSDAVSNPPHSPWSTGAAAAGFLVFGPQEWAPAAVNGVLVLGLLLVLAWLGRDLPLRWQLIVAAFVLTWPITGQAVVNSRPDIAGGLVTACTALLIVSAPWVSARRRRHVVAGVGLGVALLVKPTVSPVTLAVVLTALAAATLTDLAGGHPWRRWRPIARSWSWCLGVAALIASPYYAVAYRQVADYVRRNTFGEFAEIWRLDLDASEQALYYLTGTGGRFMLDVWLALWLCLAVGALIVAVSRRDSDALRRLPATGVVFLVSYALVTIPAHKNQFLGALLPSLMLLSTIQMMLYLCRVSRTRDVPWARYAGAFALSALSIVGLLLVRPPSHFAPWDPLPPETIRQHRALLDDVQHDIENGGDGPARVLFTHIGPYMNPPLLEFQAGVERGRELHALDVAMSSDPADLEVQLIDATEILVFSPDNPNAMSWLPAAGGQQLVFDRLAEDDGYLLSSIHPTPGGGELYLFRPASGFFGFREISGLGSVEGPYPELGLTVPVRWGLGPMSRFEIDAPASGRVRLTMSASSGLADQAMTVKVAQEVVAERTFSELGVFEEFVVDLDLPSGPYVIEIEYAHWEPPSATEARELAVLFRGLQVTARVG